MTGKHWEQQLASTSTAKVSELGLSKRVMTTIWRTKSKISPIQRWIPALKATVFHWQSGTHHVALCWKWLQFSSVVAPKMFWVTHFLGEKMWATRSCLLRASLLDVDMPPNFVHCHSSLCVLHDSLIFFGSSTVVEAAKLSIIELIKSCWRISPCRLVTFHHPYGGTAYKSINLICQVENVWFSQHGIVVFNTTLFFVFDFLLTVVFCLLHYCHNNVISRLHLN